MEIALISAVALAGYLLRPADDAERDASRTIEDDVVDVGTDINDDTMPTEQLNLHDVKAMKRFNDSFFPNQSNLIAPFYKSRAQTTNDTEKQKTHDAFTGNDATWRRKREVETLFDPTKQHIDSSGRQGNDIGYSPDQYIDSLTEINKNAKPFEQIQVGPGLGVDADVPAADGFHPMLRVFPQDGLSHKSSELAGRVNGASSVISNGTSRFALRHNAPPRVYDMSRRPLTKGGVQVEAQAARGQFSSLERGAPAKGHANPYACKVTGEFMPGVGYRPGEYVDGRESNRTGDRTTYGEFANPGSDDAMHAAGAYSVYSAGDTARIDNQHRETTNDPIGVGAVTHGRELMQCSKKQLLKEAKRGRYAEADRMAGAQRNDALLLAKLGYSVSPYMKKEHKFRQNLKNEINIRPGGALLHSAPSASNVGVMSRHGKRYGGPNPRNDFTLAADTLNDNPYTA